MPVTKLSTRHGRGTSTSQVFRRLHACRAADTVTDWRQEFLCSRTAATEQPTNRDPCPLVHFYPLLNLPLPSLQTSFMDDHTQL